MEATTQPKQELIEQAIDEAKRLITEDFQALLEEHRMKLLEATLALVQRVDTGNTGNSSVLMRFVSLNKEFHEKRKRLSEQIRGKNPIISSAIRLKIHALLNKILVEFSGIARQARDYLAGEINHETIKMVNLNDHTLTAEDITEGEFDLTNALRYGDIRRINLKKHVHLGAGTEDNQQITVQGHTEIIKEIICELVRNANHNHYDEVPPHIEEDDDWCSIGVNAKETDEHVEITVEDNGPGMPPEVLQKAATEGFTTRESGTGQGLFLCKRYIEQYLGGEFKIESEPNKGTTITFTIPKNTTIKYEEISSIEEANRFILEQMGQIIEELRTDLFEVFSEIIQMRERKAPKPEVAKVFLKTSAAIREFHTKKTELIGEEAFNSQDPIRLGLDHRIQDVLNKTGAESGTITRAIRDYCYNDKTPKAEDILWVDLNNLLLTPEYIERLDVTP